MGVVGAQEKEYNGHAEEKLFCRGILGAVVDLFPHVQVVEGAAIELEGDASYVMEHDV